MNLTLIRRSQAGDEVAFAALFHEYKNLVYKTAYLMLDNAGDAEDALQEVFVQVHRSLPTFRPSKGAFTTWLHRITVNHCLNRRRKRRLFTLPLAEISPTLLANHSPSPEGRLAEEEIVQQALSRLSEKQRAVVILRYYWDLCLMPRWPKSWTFRWAQSNHGSTWLSEPCVRNWKRWRKMLQPRAPFTQRRH